MSVSTIDALLQIATPARTIEPPSRSADEGRAFGPALEQAYKAERPRESPPSPETPPAEQDDEFNVNDSPASYDRADEGGEASGEVVEETADAGADENAEKENESGEDEVIISESASALAKEVKAVVVAVEAKAALLEAEGAAAADGAEGADAEAPAPAPAAGAHRGDEKSLENKSAAAKRRTELSGEESEKAGSKANGDTKRAKAAALAIDAAEKVADVSTDELVAVEVQAVEAIEGVETAAEEVSVQAGDDAEAREPRQAGSSTADGAERLKAPPVEQTAELAAAVERHVAQLEKVAGRKTSASEESAASAVEPVNAPASPRAAATLERLAASSLRRADNANQSEGGPQIDRPRFVQRVEGALRAAQQRDGRVQVRLAPPELGSLRIELAVQNGVMTAKLEAETPAARNALLDNLPALRERLAEQNIRVEKFDVDIRRDSQSGGGGNSGSHDRSGEHNDAGAQERRGRPAPTLPNKGLSPKTTRTANSVTDASLDVRI
jgi:flagellar hook-length control protein FliK